MSLKITPKKSLDYHQKPIPGKVALKLTKSCSSQLDLSMAYTPGVAIPCRKIAECKDDVYKYTAKGNYVAVVSDGTAVLGLGNIGPEAGMPVMEGKAVLFKQFAGIDAMGLCLDHVFDKKGKTDPKKIIETVKRLSPSFGGINLEDIAAPACFEIEERLIKELDIPVFHDDQHGTAIICLAGILNSLKLLGKKIGDVRIVVNGAGAAGISCVKMAVAAGADKKNIMLLDSAGVIYKGRKERMNKQKQQYAVKTNARSLTDALKGADIFLGLSIGNLVNTAMVRTMAKDAVIFAMANPTPEIFPADALAGGAAIVGTGRSDFPNQVNNVLGFPGIFRGALDVKASIINDEMKMAASMALAEVTAEKIPPALKKELTKIYPESKKKKLFDGSNPIKREYVIPKPFDPRVVPRVARRVAEAAIKTGVARAKIGNLAKYEKAVASFIKKG